MTTQERRAAVLAAIQDSSQPISAKTLAKQYEVSRQTIVGDIALLRAQGANVIATVSGYYIQTVQQRQQYYRGQVVCQHTPAKTRAELLAIVKNGGRVVDVTVDHPLYGELTGQLGIATLTDVNKFMQKIKANPQQRLLATLTNGVHLHTIECASEQDFERILAALSELGVRYEK